MAFRILRSLVIFIVRSIAAILGGVRVKGLEHVPRTGPVIFAPNHLSYSDGLIIGSYLPRTAWFMGKAEVFQVPFVGWLARLLHGFPVKPGAVDRSAIRRSEEILKQGDALVMFPEGRISPTGELQPLSPGVAMIALRAGAPVVPVALEGTDRLVPYSKYLPRHVGRPVKVSFGRPISPAELAGGKSGRAAVDHGTENLQQILTSLIQEAARDALPAPVVAGRNPSVS